MLNQAMENQENKKQNVNDFGHVIDVLHNKSKLSSLRTYQGDVAEFMKEKNESVISVAVKEKNREEERIEEKRIEEKKQQQLIIDPKPKPKQNNFQINLTMLFLSIFLIAGGAISVFYIYQYKNREPIKPIQLAPEIISYSKVVTLANTTTQNLGEELSKLSANNGVTLVKLTDTNGNLIKESQKFFEFLKIPDTTVIKRTLKGDFTLGTISEGNKSASFLIITTEDFGRAFASMLDWERNILTDLAFLNTKKEVLGPEVFVWKDVIIRNKDTRALIDTKGNAKIVYTFLDKNTILITNNIFVITEISTLYNSKPVVR